MQISKISIKNFRSAADLEVNIDPLTALIGGNNSGKSTILKAVELFFDAAPKFSPEDFTLNRSEFPIEISITFSNLTPLEIEEFGTAVVDDRLSITRTLSLNEESGYYSAYANSFDQFEAIRNETNGTIRNKKYAELKKQFSELPEIKSHNEINSALWDWEKKNPKKLTLAKIRDFFGAQNVASGKLKKRTSVHLIQAVRDAATDATDTKRSPIIGLLAEISRQTFENRKEISEFIEKARKEFADLADPERIPELSAISAGLTDNVKKFYFDAALNAIWQQGNGVEVSYPQPRLVVDHSGMTTELARVGHGLQRAALFAIVQFLAERQSALHAQEISKDDFQEPASDIIILLEEPEIYQHPCKQLTIFEALKGIAGKFNRKTGIRLQIIFTTHSEKFVSLRDFNVARIVRKDNKDGIPRNSVSQLKLAKCSESFANFHTPPKQPMSEEAFGAKLHIFGRELCEGFFADKVILTEGPTDKCILEATYLALSRSVHAESISILSVEGKTKLDKPAFIFTRLGIPTYVVFDNDQKKRDEKQHKDTNVLLQRIFDISNPIDFPAGCEKYYAAFSGDLECYLKSVLGDSYERLLGAVAKEFGLDQSEIIKTPAATSSLFVKAKDEGFRFELIEEIVSKVDALQKFALEPAS